MINKLTRVGAPSAPAPSPERPPAKPPKPANKPPALGSRASSSKKPKGSTSGSNPGGTRDPSKDIRHDGYDKPPKDEAERAMREAICDAKVFSSVPRERIDVASKLAAGWCGIPYPLAPSEIAKRMRQPTF